MKRRATRVTCEGRLVCPGLGGRVQKKRPSIGVLSRRKLESAVRSRRRESLPCHRPPLLRALEVVAHAGEAPPPRQLPVAEVLDDAGESGYQRIRQRRVEPCRADLAA